MTEIPRWSPQNTCDACSTLWSSPTWLWWQRNQACRLLAHGARPIADLSAATGVDAHSLYCVLRALASRGLFREDDNQRFSLTPLAGPLRGDAPQSIRLTGNSCCGWEQRRSGRSPGTLIQRRDITGR